ncbi:hypothetical protein DPSP01_004163 [Paraphaeosphaeria sporulosa]|uniref:PH domain-containing protein n=1 Tax=Paraphaeosphaeria sporulosa TaxID=1460663 RepID=A0A177CCL8_9PLEO|nr:uncharacterized protein CC84DRAFT_1196742 [Paraphaeosphaeria sporulosa]OAG04632.1 hypothetical protein CC84DRAFT_1196742 [Paraphaeosphaeria sporulosa]
MAETAPSSEQTPQKFSRYRSVRRAQAQQQALHQNPVETPNIPAMPPIPMEAANAAPVSRSMSRYHRRPTTSQLSTAKAPPLLPATVNVSAQPVVPQDSTTVRNRALSSPYMRAAPNVSPRVPNTSRTRAEAAPLPATQPRPRTARDEAKQLMQDEADRQRRMREQIEAEKRAKAKAEQAEREREEQQRIAAEEAERLRSQEEAHAAEQLRRQKEDKDRGKRLQKAESTKRLQEREEAERRARIEEAARTVPVSPPTSPPRHGGRFGIFGRRRDNSAASQSPPSTARPSHTSHENRDMETIRPGGGGAVLGIDAPISAVNAGDRRVSILCNKKTFLLPVTPETTAQDLLRSASIVMTEKIDSYADILVENFAKVSVQRPLRMYEHVRDVMNSWDNDTQNDLEIINAAYTGHDRATLLSSQVPDDKPEGLSCFIYYSSRPGKWNKKYVTLRSDGQLVMAKNETAKDQESICHMSDFDIYRPTELKLKKIKPPKSFCYAVKSQQKSNIFSDESRYVHFFCTSDNSTSVKFHSMLQTWRSWHLKHVMGEGQKKPKPQEPKPANAFLTKTQALGSLDQGPVTSHRRNASENSFYQLGSFKPLFDLEELGKSLDPTAQQSAAPEGSFARMNSRAMHARKMSSRQKAPPPVAYTRSGLVDEIPDMPVVERTNSLTQTTTRPDDEETFAAGGLLGRKYSQRQRAVQEREAQANGPFTAGPSLVGSIDALTAAQAAGGNDGGLGRRSSVRSTHRRTSSDIQRSASTRMKPRPLVDLTPQYKEPPQFRNKGKGFKPEGSAGPLVENATSPEEAIQVPPSQDWRAGAVRPMTARAHGSYGTSGHERTRSLKGRGEGLAAYTVNNHTAGIDDDRQAFTGGLLARAGFSQGAQPVGHGVMDGSKARGPMLDMSEPSQFASGSLLAGVQRKQTVKGPVIDRDRRQSVEMG